ncbi:MAG: hypothetical protein HKN26_07565 [Acidimicrobiales bacterium]|nr:hypothetical protein [Acidimicrobiales bacterium]
MVSVSDGPDDAQALLDLDAEAKAAGVTVLAGAGFMPGLSCVLVRHAAEVFDHVEEIHVAKSGAGGPACARQYHAALGQTAQRWDGGWQRDRGGSGRELMWFPDPVASQDCYRGALPDAVLLRAAFPETDRIDARMAANRRDRFTMRLPMLRPPHRPEGGIGAVRIEVWGRRGAARDVVVFGAVDRPSVAAGAVAAVAAVEIARGSAARPGAHSVAELLTDSGAFLAELARRGVRAAVFEGERSALARPAALDDRAP